MKVLLLSGTAEARALAAALTGRPDIDLVASLAGATEAPASMPCKTRIGGFGGVEGFAAYLKAERVAAVIDATHPFAAVMSATAATVCRAMNLPHLRLLRPKWRPGPGDRWTLIDCEEDAADLIPAEACVFLATGHKHVDRFGNLAGRRVICRRIDANAEPFPLPGGEWLVARPPFTVAAEIALFHRLGVDWLVAKNAGGAASRAKLDAARALGLPVAMIRRPDPPQAMIVDSVDAALTWLVRA